MTSPVDPDRRIAPSPAASHTGGVTLMNGFVVPPGRDDAFLALWTAASNYFRAQPGYLSLRLHRALSPGAAHRFVNVARWRSLEEFQAAHKTEAFRKLVSQDGWNEFPNNPSLYEVAAENTAADASDNSAQSLSPAR